MATTKPQEFAPIYQSVVDENPTRKGFYALGPQWLQWFLTIVARLTTSVQFFSTTSASVTTTLVDQVIATQAYTAGSVLPKFLQVTGVLAIGPAAGSPATFEEVVLSLYDGVTLLGSSTVAVAGNIKSQITCTAVDTTSFIKGTTYTFTLKAKRTGSPSAISPVVTGSQFSIFGQNT